jgi:hypothetical protein
MMADGSLAKREGGRAEACSRLVVWWVDGLMVWWCVVVSWKMEMVMVMLPFSGSGLILIAAPSIDHICITSVMAQQFYCQINHFSKSQITGA